MPNTSLSLSDRHRTVVLHVIELQPQAYTWQMVLEEHCGSADCDCSSLSTDTEQTSSAKKRAHQYT